MKEREKKIISVIATTLSLVAIYLLSLNAFVDVISVCDIDSGMIGSTIDVSGKAVNIRVSEGNIFFTLHENGCEIKVVVWKSTAESLDNTLEENDNISIGGYVESYHGELEIITNILKS